METNTILSLAAMCLSATLIVMGAMLGSIFRNLRERMQNVENVAKAAKEGLETYKQNVLEARAHCREEIFGAFSAKSDVSEMHSATKEAIRELGKMLETRLAETRITLVEKLNLLSSEGISTKEEILSFLRSHRHDQEGKVFFPGI